MSSRTCFDLDAAVIDFMATVEELERERVIGKDTAPKPKTGETLVPKYASISEILDLFEPPAAATGPQPVQKDPYQSIRDEIVADLKSQQEPAF